jgi:putative cyclase
MPTNIGTFIDSPFHRYRDGTDLGGISMEELAGLDGVVVDVSASGGEVTLGDDAELRRKAVLFRSGWDERWGTDAYWEPGPFLSRQAIEHLVAAGPLLVGSTSGTSTTPPTHPARRTPGYSRPESSLSSTSATLGLCRARAFASSLRFWRSAGAPRSPSELSLNSLEWLGMRADWIRPRGQGLRRSGSSTSRQGLVSFLAPTGAGPHHLGVGAPNPSRSPVRPSSAQGSHCLHRRARGLSASRDQGLRGTTKPTDA